MEDIVKVFKALSDETRLRILTLIEQQELCVCEVMQILNMGQSRISHHLNILRDAGLAKARRKGTWTFYSSAGSESSLYHARIMEILNNWIKKDDLARIDLANLGKCIANRAENECCSLSEIT